MPNQFEKPKERLDPRKEKFSIEKIESLPIRDFDKVDFILLLSGYKKAVDINVHKYDNEWQNTIRDMGLYFVEDESLSDDKKRKFYIAQSQEGAEKFFNALTKNDDVEAGILSGYPLSAIENYVQTMKDLRSHNLTETEVVDLLKERYIEVVDLPLEAEEIERLLPFAHFSLSKKKWMQEIETVKEWANTIKNLDPALYTRITKFYKSTPDRDA
ncbi:hypothetical protein MYX07_03220 [Patescibacteria group bacterium AH-259-L07]|nr:hypothetical protein [Patescibacteria group bacterium AH-259-L07]